MLKLNFLFGVLLWAVTVSAQTVKGKVYDAETKEPLFGVSVVLKGTDKGAATGFDGSFSIKGMAAGTYTLQAFFISYEKFEQQITVKGTDTDDLRIDLVPVSQYINEVTIFATADKSTVASARATERNADNVVNVISARSIELSPDLDVANVIRRISGVSLEQNGSSSGKSHSIIRGMSKRYNYTLINGIKIPSPDDKNRYVPLDIFPSEMVDRVEVTKSLTPSMEGDAVGGVIDMVMKDAPDKLMINANFSTGYHELFASKAFRYFDSGELNQKSPLQKFGTNYSAAQSDFTTKNLELQERSFVPDLYGALSVGNRFFGGRLGAIVSGSYSRVHQGANSTRFVTDLVPATTLTKLTGISEREYFSLVERMGVHTKLDYHFNGQHQLKLYAAYLQLGEDEVRDMQDVSVLGSSNVLDSDRRKYETRYAQTVQKITNFTLQGVHKFGENSRLEWSGSFSKARKDRPDEAHFVRISNLSLHKGQESILVAEDGDNIRYWRFNNDRDISGYLDYTLNFDLGSLENEVKVGGLYRNKYRNSFYNHYSFDPSPGVQAFGNSWVPDAESSSISYGTWEQYGDVQFKVGNPSGSTTNEFNHKFYETITAGYIQFKALAYHKIQVLGGVRVEQTNWKYTLLAPRPKQEPKGGLDHMDVLPSLHVKYKVNEQSNIRASYFYSVIRPGYYEILPYTDRDEDYLEIGNPNIKRIKAHNYDLRYENYFTKIDQFLIGVFYKRITDPIEYARVNGETTYKSVSGWVRMPNNFGEASNYGLELDFTKYIGHLGFRFNYTFTLSEITHSKVTIEREIPGDTSSKIISGTAMQTRPLQGQSKHIGNASVLYKNPRNGLDAQLALVYTGERIKNVSGYLDNDEWERPFVSLDFSAEKKLGKFALFVNAKNILNNAYEVVIKQPLRIENQDFPLQGNVGGDNLIRRDIYQRSFRLGCKYKF